MDMARQRPALDVDRLRRDHTGADRMWRRLDVVEETGSTNADLLARARSGQDIRGAVVIAEFQTAGRGRHGRVWSAPPRSQIAMSVGVDASDVPSSAWGWLALAAGVAVVHAVRMVSEIDARLKWPNDVLVDDGKLAGILAEVAAPEDVVVVGLGLNVTLTAEERPHPMATSLALLGHPGVDRSSLLGHLLEAVAARVDDWRAHSGNDAGLAAEYRLLSATLGTRVRVGLPGGQQLVGIAHDIDALGRLVVDTAEGSVTVSAGDVTHLRTDHPSA